MTNNIKILIVDDDLRNIRILTEMLEDLFQLDTADSGASALNKVNTFQPDLVLLDYMMPDIDGLEICRSIRNNTQVSRDLKLIIVSGRASNVDINEGLSAGANAYLTKPFNENTLMNTLREALDLDPAMH